MVLEPRADARDDCGREQELPVHAEVPDPRLEDDDEPDRDEEQRSNAHGGVLPRCKLDAAGPDVLVVLNWVDADRGEDDRAGAEGEQERQDRAHENIADGPQPGVPAGRLARGQRLSEFGGSAGRVGHAAFPPTMSSPISAARTARCRRRPQHAHAT